MQTLPPSETSVPVSPKACFYDLSFYFSLEVLDMWFSAQPHLELARDADSQAPSWTDGSESLGLGPAICIPTRSPGDSDAPQS